MNMNTPVLSDLGEAALRYAKKGWRVFPLNPGRKDPLISKRMGGRGYHDGTTDPKQIAKWWTATPNANIGLALAPSGLVALDPDLYKPECQWLNFINGRDLPDTLVQTSARGGKHYIYTCAPGATFPGDLCKGVEIKHNGYIVLEPSVFEGKQYRFETDDDPAPAPDWLMALDGQGNALLTIDSLNAAKDVGDYVALIKKAMTVGDLNAGQTPLAAFLAQQGVKRAFTEALLRTISPVYDDKSAHRIETAYEKYGGSDFRHNTLDLVRDGQGRPIWNAANAEALLTQHPDWQGVLGFNEFTGRRTFRGRDLGDDDYTDATAWFNRNGFPKASETITVPAIRRCCKANSFDPLQHYLNGLNWDGVRRTKTWLMDYAGAEDTRFNREAGACWLISAVARAFEPGVKVDHMLVLEGDQGVGKSSGIRALAGGDDMFGDNLPDMTHKDAQEYVRGKWIVEVAELVAARREINAVKAFITRQTDEFRWSYAREVVQQPRRCVFIGTANDDQYLRDESGNRRFWPVRVGALDVAGLARDRDQLWAEAVELYRRGVKWWLSPEVETMAQEAQAARLDVDPWHADVAAYVEGKDSVAPRQVIAEALGKVASDITRSDSNRVCGILRTLGFKRDGKVTSGKFKDGPKYTRRAP